MNPAERTYHNKLINSLRPVIMSAKAQLGITACERCHTPNGPLEINHLRYGPDITLRDLELLCYLCHAAQTAWARETAQHGNYCPHCQRAY